MHKILSLIPADDWTNADDLYKLGITEDVLQELKNLNLIRWEEKRQQPFFRSHLPRHTYKRSYLGTNWLTSYHKQQQQEMEARKMRRMMGLGVFFAAIAALPVIASPVRWLLNKLRCKP